MKRALFFFLSVLLIGVNAYAEREVIIRPAPAVKRPPVSSSSTVASTKPSAETLPLKPVEKPVQKAVAPAPKRDIQRPVAPESGVSVAKAASPKPSVRTAPAVKTEAKPPKPQPVEEAKKPHPEGEYKSFFQGIVDRFRSRA